MKKRTLLKYYKQYNKAQSYIVGFVYDGMLYFINMATISAQYLSIEQASRGQGNNLRLRLKKAQKEKLLKNATCIGLSNLLVADNKYNKGENFERIIHEYYGKVWHKDTIPFWVQGDINVNGIEIQIKLDSATLTTEKTIKKLKQKFATD